MKNKVDKKLAVNEKLLGFEPEFMEICQDGVLKFGKISITYLMRKLKCSAPVAKKIYDQYVFATE